MVAHQFFYNELFSTLSKLVAKRSIELVIMPFGEIYGDSELQRMAHAAIPGAKIVTARLTALERWRLVGALDLHLCTRWHAMLAAFAQDVPFLVMDEYLCDATASSKIREFIVRHGARGALPRAIPIDQARREARQRALARQRRLLLRGAPLGHAEIACAATTR